jgi:hypothetical protein
MNELKKSKPMMRASLFRLLDEQRKALNNAYKDPSLRDMTPAQNKAALRKMNLLKKSIENTTARIASNTRK